MISKLDDEGIRHFVAAIQQPFLFFKLLLFRQFVHLIRRGRRRRFEMLTSSQRVKISFTTQCFISSYGHRNSPCVSFRSTTPHSFCVCGLRTIAWKQENHNNWIVLLLRSNRRHVVNTPHVSHKENDPAKENCWYTHRHEAGRCPQGRECYGPSMLILCKLKHSKSHILSRRYMGKKITVPNKTGMTCEHQMCKWWRESIFSS